MNRLMNLLEVSLDDEEEVIPRCLDMKTMKIQRLDPLVRNHGMSIAEGVREDAMEGEGKKIEG